MFKIFCSHEDSNTVLWRGSPKHFHQVILISVFSYLIFHLCPKTKTNFVRNIWEKQFFKTKLINYILQIKLTIVNNS